MKANNMKKVYETLTGIVNYLNNEVERTGKCKKCKYKGKSFRGEPCYWHVDCSIEDYDKKASNNAMYLLKRFKLQKAITTQPRNCDIGTAAQQKARFKKFCDLYRDDCSACPLVDCDDDAVIDCDDDVGCAIAFMQMPYKKEVDNEQK